MTAPAIFRRRRRGDAASAASLLTDPTTVLAYEAPAAAGAQTGTSVVGPDYTRGSTSGADTNDTIYTTAAGAIPAHDLFGVDDYNTWAVVAAIKSAHANAGGWWFYAAITPATANGDLSAFKNVFTSIGSGGMAVRICATATSKLRALVYYGDNSANFDRLDSTTSLVNDGKHVVCVTFDPTQAKASRIKMWIDGASDAGSYATAGADGTISSAGTQPVLMGYESFFSVVAGISRMSGVYLGTGLRTGAQVTTDTAFIRTRLGY